MQNKHLLEQLNQKKADLDLFRPFRDHAIQCKADLYSFVTDSEQRVEEGIRQGQDFEKIDQLKQQFALDKQVYALCDEIIMEYHADMEMIKIEINCLEKKLISLSAQAAFFKRQQHSDNQEKNSLCDLLDRDQCLFNTQ